MRAQEIIRRPMITEKSTELRDTRNIVAFEVNPRATKIDIRRAVEKQFDVEVGDVRVVTVRGKMRRQGRYVGKRPNWKKAYVRLTKGTIDFFEGV